MEKALHKKHQNQVSDKPGFNFVGFPDDLGIRNVNGRLGAREGPQSFWDVFQKVKGQNPVHDRMHAMEVVSMGPQLESNYDAAAMVVARLKQSQPKDFLLAVGGGHDYAYPWIRGWVNGCREIARKTAKKGSKTQRKVGCINLDAHFDLRDFQPTMTSGSPFRRLIDEEILDSSRLVEFGIQTHSNSPELWKVAEKYGIKTYPMEELRNGKAVPAFKSALKSLGSRCDEILISVDLDALSYAYAPGVSAPQAEGFTASELFQMLELAGSDKKVTSVAFFELSPPLDFQNYTSRLTAQAAWHFLDAALF